MKNFNESEQMAELEKYGIQVPEILLPKNIDIKTWSVIACDQYTQDADYWKKAEDTVGTKPSTLNLILPEVYLNSSDKNDRIKKIRESMKTYLEGGVFNSPHKCMVYVERKTAFGRTRRGLVTQIDLETYEWKPFSSANIRATEATIMERIPPRMEIRRGAPLELPHIMLLADDKEDCLVGGAGKLAKGKTPLYQGELMSNGGYITGWAVESDDELKAVSAAVHALAEQKRNADGSTFLFAVGDGNHSLATAKAVWDEHKAALLEKGAGEQELRSCPVRYALVEIVNIYDAGLTFEPIHRVIFNVSGDDVISALAEKLSGKAEQVPSGAELEARVRASHADFGFAFCDQKSGAQKFVILHTDITELAVARLQPAIDEFLKSLPASGGNVSGSLPAGGNSPATTVATPAKKPEIDYIHGADEVLRLGERPASVGILLPPIAKDSFFETISGRGPLPRKSFSMGEADEKRFYLECRTLFEI